VNVCGIVGRLISGAASVIANGGKDSSCINMAGQDNHILSRCALFLV
jgi:hypothetical protein